MHQQNSHLLVEIILQIKENMQYSPLSDHYVRKATWYDDQGWVPEPILVDTVSPCRAFPRSSDHTDVKNIISHHSSLEKEEVITLYWRFVVPASHHHTILEEMKGTMSKRKIPNERGTCSRGTYSIVGSWNLLRNFPSLTTMMAWDIQMRKSSMWTPNSTTTMPEDSC